MPWIDVVAHDQAEGLLKAEYDAALQRAGRIWHVVSLMSQNPRAMQQSMRSASCKVDQECSGADRDQRVEELEHCLRALAHVIDMHQLTKDPSLAVTVAGKTASSPQRVLSSFEVTRYLDYSSEMVSLTSKVAVLFAQGFPDPVVTEVVSDIERVAAGLSQKIWQKIMIVQSSAALQSAVHAMPASPHHPTAAPAQSASPPPESS